MLKKFDLIQRFEVEEGVPRLVSTSIQVLEGGEDLMSLATAMLTKLGFDQNYELSRASQYVGYRLKKPKKGAKRYQLVLAQRKEGLCISIPRDTLNPYLLDLKRLAYDEEEMEVTHGTAGRFYVLPGKKDIFLNSLNPIYWSLLDGKTEGTFYLNESENDGWNDYPPLPSQLLDEFQPDTLSDSGSYLVLHEDKLFPYTWQVTINSSKVLEEFLSHIVKVLMENQ